MDPQGGRRRPATADALFSAAAAGAGALALAQGPHTPLVLGSLVIALVPWGLLLAGRDPALPVFAALAVLPVAPVVAATGPVSYLTGEGDVGAAYFAFGSLFGLLAGVLLRRATRLAEDLRVAQARLADVAAREERHRIARDVHDLVAHSLTVVVLHVGGARRVLRSDPTAAQGALEDAERVCRESLDGIRGVVGLLRDDADRPALSLDLGDLVQTYRAAGVPVALGTSGDVGELPLVVRVTLHRVVQEALANAARHAGAGAATAVDVAVEDAGVLARVTSDRTPGPGAAAGTAGGHGGYGLAGLREQVASLGGELSSGPREATWVVECRLPTTRERRAAPDRARDRAGSAAASGGGA